MCSAGTAGFGDLPPSGDDDVDAVVAFYERTGAMPVTTIGPPTDRPIIPSRRPDRIGDFVFSPDSDDRPDIAPRAARSEDAGAAEIRSGFGAMLDDELGPR